MFRKVLYCIKGCRRYVLKLLNQSWVFISLVVGETCSFRVGVSWSCDLFARVLYEDSVMEGTRIVPLRSLTALVN